MNAIPARDQVINFIPIASAFICCQCQGVIATAQVCPNCGSAQSIASLSAWLNRRDLSEATRALNLISAVMAAK